MDTMERTRVGHRPAAREPLARTRQVRAVNPTRRDRAAATRGQAGRVQVPKRGSVQMDSVRTVAEGRIGAPQVEPGRPTVTRRPAQAGPATSKKPAATRAGRAASIVPRTPFALLMLALLGGALICLLVINTTLGATSFRISQLQSTGTRLSEQEHNLQRQVASAESPQQIAQRAEQLGMRPQTQLNFINARTHRIYTQHAHPGTRPAR